MATFIGFFANIKTNLGILGENFKIAFDNIPGAIQAGLNGALRLIETFIQKASLGLGDKVAKKL